MVIRFGPSAFRHGISEERARYVIEHCPSPAYSRDDTSERDLVIYLWTDQHGVPLEVVGIEFETGDVLVIHAMRMRTRYDRDFVRNSEWLRR